MIAPELQALVAGLIGFAVTAGIKSLFEATGIDLSSLASGITAALVTSLMFFLNNAVASLPPEWQPVVGPACLLIVAVFSAMGIHYTFKKIRPVRREVL